MRCGRWLFFFQSRSAGKAVKTGHSCAAVTHHKPRRASSGVRKANRHASVGEGEGRGRAEKSAQELRSPNICPGDAHAFRRELCARRLAKTSSQK
jgi:hypothetical protein